MNPIGLVVGIFIVVLIAGALIQVSVVQTLLTDSGYSAGEFLIGLTLIASILFVAMYALTYRW